MNSHRSPQSTPRRTLDAAGKVYWWKVPDDEELLMSLRPAELRCYLVVVRSIQRDQWGGCISLRQVATRAKLGIRHARTALDSIVAKGLLDRETRTKAMPRYALPNTFATGDCVPAGPSLADLEAKICSPTGAQNVRLIRQTVSPRVHSSDEPEAVANPVGAQICNPTGAHNCSPTGAQHSERELRVNGVSSLSEDPGSLKEQGEPTEPTMTTPAELAELLPDWLDAEVQRRIWQGSRQFATDCTLEEVAAAVQDKLRVLGKKTNPGLLITSVPKMFEGPRGFHHRSRQRAAEQERQRQELERIEQLAVPTVVSNTGTNGLKRSQEPPSDMTPKVSAPTSPAAEVCLRCGSDGVVNGTVSWCDCERGREQRRARPGYVDYLIRKGWKPGAIAAAVQPRPPQSEPGPLRDVATAAGGAR